MAKLTAILDANVLYPAPMRDLLLRLASAELFIPYWTEQIHDEWMNAVLRDRPDISVQKLRRTRELMDRHFPGAIVKGHQPLIERLELPDPHDRHVLAAAIRSKAGVIVTMNLKHFPGPALEKLNVRPQHPDAFVCQMMDLDAAAVESAVCRQRADLKHPVVSVNDFLETLSRQGLKKAVVRLRAFAERL